MSVTDNQTPSDRSTSPEKVEVDEKSIVGAASPSGDLAAAKHPLQHEWTFWYNPPNKAAANGVWTSNVRQILTISSIEDFWRLFNVLKQPSLLTKGSNYHLFKAGIAPEWEDEQNKKGGKWLICFARGETSRVDSAWLETLLALIGEQFNFDSQSNQLDDSNNDADEICGVVIAPRKSDTKLALWTRHADDAQCVKKIGQVWKSLICTEGEKLGFLVHDEALQRQSSFRLNQKYTV